MERKRSGEVVIFHYPKGIDESVVKGVGCGEGFHSRDVPTHVQSLYIGRASLSCGSRVGNHCVYGDGYHDIEHVVRSCPENRGPRSQFVDSLRARGRPPYVPIRDVLGRLDLQYMFLLYDFLKHINVPI